MLVISWFVCGMIAMVFYYAIFNNLLFNNTIRVNYKLLFYSLGFGILNVMKLKMDINAVYPFIIHFWVLIGLKRIFNKDVVTTLITEIIEVLLVFSAELLFEIILAFIFKVDVNYYVTMPVGYLIINICIYYMAYIISNNKLIMKLNYKIVKWNNKSHIGMYILFFFTLSITVFLLYVDFIKTFPASTLWLTNLFCIGVFVFIIGYFIEKANNNKLKDDYQRLMEYTKTYEDLLDEKNKRQHEYKNQLVLISDMTSVKKVREYIKRLTNEEDENIEYNWMNKIKYLPSGGIKGLVYYKIKSMIQKGITPFVDISKEIENKRIIKICNNNLKDISMILGILFDNAIEAAINSDKKSIVISAYLDDGEIIISISNTYNQIDFKKIDKERYTTKGKGHGYGLSIIKDIISKNNNLTITREITDIYYTNKIHIKK